MNINNVNENDNVGKEEKNTLRYEFDLHFLSGTREGLFAREIAEGLNDMKNIRYYFSVALEHSERYLMEIYRKVKETPEQRIRKSRGALFTYLVKKYERFDTDN